MKRRHFLKRSVAAGIGVVSSTYASRTFAAPPRSSGPRQTHEFNLNYAPHFGMFSEHAGDDPVAQLEFAAEVGFTAWEDNGMMGRPVEEQERIADAMDRLGIEMGVFVAHGDFGQVSFARQDEEVWQSVLDDIRSAIDVAHRVNATWMTVVPGAEDPRLAHGFQMANTVKLLRRCAELLEPHDLTMVLEPLNYHTDHPGLFLTRSDQAYQLCEAVDSPACKILFDVYHQQITEGNLIPNIETAWDHIGYFQMGDNPGRNEPTTGEINYRNIFRYVHERGFDGILGMEHGNSQPGEEGEQAVIDAYVWADDFETA